ncbi:MAG: hypothetical protein CFE24_01305 [Flavobacterium sp. BFFFF2]|nr:MAG: hypothetical protein CFE24_01305 [Flavobacterium sp. BFFFF2]
MSRDQKAVIWSILFYLLIVGALYLIRFWPPYQEEKYTAGGGGGGIELNFGFTDQGQGNQSASTSQPIEQPKTAVNEQPEAIIADANSDQAVISTPKPKEDKESKPKETTPVKAQPRKLESESLLNSMLGGGDGNDGKQGNKGSKSGNPLAGGYGAGGSGDGSGGGDGSGKGLGKGSGYGTGSGGGAGGGNYQLGNRKALRKPNPEYNCNEQGIVVVQIVVDQNGKVIEARPGARGTTTPAKCLWDQAQRAALETVWSSDKSAPNQQTGKIIYSFQLQ